MIETRYKVSVGPTSRIIPFAKVLYRRSLRRSLVLRAGFRTFFIANSSASYNVFNSGHFGVRKKMAEWSWKGLSQHVSTFCSRDERDLSYASQDNDGDSLRTSRAVECIRCHLRQHCVDGHHRARGLHCVLCGVL
jgi:hypothetical protein